MTFFEFGKHERGGSAKGAHCRPEPVVAILCNGIANLSSNSVPKKCRFCGVFNGFRSQTLYFKAFLNKKQVVKKGD